MIAMFLSTIIIIGAFHMHSTFQYQLHRQDEVTQMQQTMKVTRRLLERRIRAAGAGMTGTSVNWCGGEHQVGPFVIHNKNTFNVRDDTEGGADDDPDWFEVMAADRSKNGILTGKNPHPVVGVEKSVDKPENFAVGSLIGLQNENGVCIFMVTRVDNNKIQYRPAGSNPLFKCFNAAAITQQCRKNVLQAQFLHPGSEILNFSSGTFALRVDDSVPARPVLMMASGVAGADPTQYDWQPVVRGVEDMQIGVYLDTSSPPDRYGDLWVNSRDLTVNELNRVRAVRLSLVFRSTTRVPGWTAGRRVALEDRPAATARDGYLRRVLTTTIKLRNTPEEPSP